MKMILRDKNNMTQYIRHIISHIGSAASTLRRTLTLLLLMATLGGGYLFAQTHPYSGVWYITNNTNSMIGYWVPANNPQITTTGHVYEDAYFSSNYNTQYGDPEKPFLTTYPTNGDINSIWIFVPVSGENNYYYIVHALTGKYLKYQPYLTGDNLRRKFVHLETITTPGETEKFEITEYDTGVKIKSKNNNMCFNVAGGNQEAYHGSTGNKSPYFSGLIGGYNTLDDGSKFMLIDASSATDLTPVISDLNGSSNTYSITSPAAAFSTLRYTTDGSTTPNANTGTTAASGDNINITGIISVQAVGVFGSYVTPVAGPKPLSPAPCATPVISFDYTTSEVSITCATASTTIYYTTDGSDPTSESEEYSVPFTVSGATTIKAIATRTDFPNSQVGSLVISQVATPTIQNNGSNAISITTATPGATIYYTTNGDTPTTSDSEYTTPLQENVSGVTIKAIAVKENMITSAVGSGTVTLQCATPVISRDGLRFTISCSLPADANIYYRLDGGTEVQYQGTPVSFTSDQLPMTVTAVARHNSYTQSETATRVLKNGAGTESDPYLIYGTSDFTHFVNDVNSGTTTTAFYKLGTNVSANGIGAITADFKGTFDGGSFTITDLDHPLFSTIDGAVVKNVTLKDVNISSSLDTLGAIACIAKGYSRIYNCGILPNAPAFPEGTHPSVSTTGNCAGGLVGSLRNDSRVINCYSYADVSASNTASGIVGRNTFASTAAVSGGKYTSLRTAIVNCMFYGDINGGTNQYGVYGGELITNATATGISSYNYFRSESKFTAANGHPNTSGGENVVGNPTAYNCSFPADERYLTQVEFHRSLLNSNRELCGWWVGSDVAPRTLTTAEVQAIPKNASLMYKWVVDPNLAPYPILKPFGKYASITNGNTGTPWIDRSTANPFEGKRLGTLTVTVQSGDHSSASDQTLYLPITDMDTLHYDFGYRKVQLPYFNSVFGDPEGDTWEKKYAGNYTDYVVTGWKVTDVTDDDRERNAFVEDWQDGYNFADRNCTDKDLYRVFAQGGNYYVPDGVTAITIKAYWGKAIYVCDNGNSYDRVNITDGTTGSAFAPAGTRDNNVNGATVYTTNIRSVIGNVDQKKTVYDYAVVLVGNVQESNGNNAVTVSGHNTYGFTIMSADFDFDEEPDYCLEWQLGSGTTRNYIAPIRFDFLPVVELGIAGKLHNSTNFFTLGCFRPYGHFEVTETAFIRFGQFEFENDKTRDPGPIILNGGIFDQYTRGRNNESNQNITYVIVGGHLVMPSFTPGAHVGQKLQTRHCAVNALGGDFTSFYLTGGYREDVDPYDDNPHCYIDGGRFGTIAAACKEGIKGNVTWRINHALIREFYGGGIMSNANMIVQGSIDVVIDNSIVGKYCGGPKFGDMVSGKTVTTRATNTTFGEYYGAGNGGTNYVQFANDDKTDGPRTAAQWYTLLTSSGTGKYSANKYINTAKGYHANYDYEEIKPSTGTTSNQAIDRIYYYSAQFATTNTGNVSSTLTNCTIEKNFYGGGFLGGVTGSVTSTLNSTHVLGSVFGAGYSASSGTVTIHNTDKTPPVYNVYTGMIKPQSGGTSTTYYWTHDAGSTSSPVTTDDDKNYFYTEIPLTNLGAVSGAVTLTITGNSIIGTEGDNTTGNVYGGGDQSQVKDTTSPENASTTVRISGNTEIKGSVFGGGNQGDVSGSTQVIIE